MSLSAKNRPTLELAAKRIDSRLSVSGVYGFDITTIITLLPTLISLFQSCKKPTPTPPNPVQNPSTAQQQAWELKCTATEGYDADHADYDRALLNRTARQCKRARRKDGEECSKSESLELARAALDEARLNDVDTIAKGIEESR